MAAYNHRRFSLQENYLSSSPKLTTVPIDEVKTTENDGVPLNTTWTFWLDKSVRYASAAQYEALLRKIHTVNTVQGFWGVFNSIPKVNEIEQRSSYHLMRYERRPVWEEPCYSQGGSWKLKCKKEDTEEVWRELLLAAIGEQFTHSIAKGDDMSGLSISVREREDIIQVWNTRADLAEQATILEKIQSLVPHVTFPTIFYKAFYTHEAFEGSKG